MVSAMTFVFLLLEKNDWINLSEYAQKLRLTFLPEISPLLNAITLCSYLCYSKAPFMLREELDKMDIARVEPDVYRFF